MNTRRLRIVGGGGDPDPAPALRVDVVAAAEQLVEAIDAKGMSEPEWHTGVSLATDEVYRRTKRYLKACRERAR